MIKLKVNQLNDSELLKCGLILLISASLNILFNLSTGEFGSTPANLARTFFHNAHVFHTKGFIGLIEEPYPMYYWLYPVFLSIIRYSLGLQSSVVIIIQIFLTSLSSILIYKISALYYNRSTALIAAFLFIMTWQIFRWSHFILNDAIYIFLLLICIYLILLLRSEYNLYYLAPIIIILNLLLFLTPNSIVFIILSTILIAIVLMKQKKYGAISFSVVLLVVPLLFIHSFPDSLIRLNLIQQGVVVPGIPQYDIGMRTILNNEAISSVVFYITVIAKRIIYFWSIYLAPHSTMHRLFNLAWLLPLYGFGIFGIIKIAKQKTSKFFIILTLGLIIGYTVFHSLTSLDYDQRYRAPLLAILTIYASFGLNYFYSNYFKTLIDKVKA